MICRARCTSCASSHLASFGSFFPPPARELLRAPLFHRNHSAVRSPSKQQQPQRLDRRITSRSVRTFEQGALPPEGDGIWTTLAGQESPTDKAKEVAAMLKAVHA